MGVWETSARGNALSTACKTLQDAMDDMKRLINDRAKLIDISNMLRCDLQHAMGTAPSASATVPDPGRVPPSHPTVHTMEDNIRKLIEENSRLKAGGLPTPQCLGHERLLALWAGYIGDGKDEWSGCSRCAEQQYPRARQPRAPPLRPKKHCLCPGRSQAGGRPPCRTLPLWGELCHPSYMQSPCHGALVRAICFMGRKGGRPSRPQCRGVTVL